MLRGIALWASALAMATLAGVTIWAMTSFEEPQGTAASDQPTGEPTRDPTDRLERAGVTDCHRVKTIPIAGARECRYDKVWLIAVTGEDVSEDKAFRTRVCKHLPAVVALGPDLLVTAPDKPSLTRELGTELDLEVGPGCTREGNGKL